MPLAFWGRRIACVVTAKSSTKPSFVKLCGQLLTAWGENDAAKMESLRRELRKSLSAEEWEYLTWEEWKEGLAENKGGESPPYDRVTFYRGGDEFIRFLERRQPGIAADMEKLSRPMSAATFRTAN